MAQTYTTNAASDTTQGVQSDYPLDMDRGIPGQLADLSDTHVISGSNETANRIAYGVPLVRNNSGVLPNSAQPATAASTLLGLHVRTHTQEFSPPPNYSQGVPPGQAINILKRGAIYLEVVEAVAPGDALRYYKSGPNAGKWGKTASAGNSLLLTAGNWEIQKAGKVGQVLKVYFNCPANVAVTADT
jgi:hypothetical protein